MVKYFKKTMLRTIKSRGFTIVELLVVIAIIGLLASIIFVATKDASKKAQYAKVFSFATTINHAIGAESVGEWKLNEGTGTSTADSSGNNTTLYFYGAPLPPVWILNDGIPELSWAVDPGALAACLISGAGPSTCAPASGGNVSTSSPLNLGGKSITITLWARNTATVGTADRYFIRLWDTTSSQGQYGVYKENSPNVLRLFLGSSIYTNDTDPLPTTGEWTFIVVSYDKNSNIVKGYLNDKNISFSGPASPVAWDTLLNPAYLRVGYALGARVDDIHIYADVLSTSQVRQLYAEGATKHGVAVNE
jgi:prepilin-type N-terminal cleavage/methylation domain-containing protein